MVFFQILFAILLLSRVAGEECVNKSSNTTANDTNSLAHYFIQENMFEEMITLLINQRELAFTADKNNWTPLHEAARSGNVLMIEFLVENGADALARTFDHRTPRDILSSSLIEALPELNNYSAKSYKLSEFILRQAEQGKGMNGHVIDSYSQDVIVNFPGLAMDLIKDDLPEILEDYFHMNGDIIKQVDDNGWSLLHEAARTGNIRILSFLIDNGANIYAKNARGEIPLDIATQFAKNGNSRINDEATYFLKNKMRKDLGIHHDTSVKNIRKELEINSQIYQTNVRLSKLLRYY